MGLFYLYSREKEKEEEEKYLRSLKELQNSRIPTSKELKSTPRLVVKIKDERTSNRKNKQEAKQNVL